MQEESKARRGGRKKPKTKARKGVEIDFGRFSLTECENEFDHTDFVESCVEAQIAKLSFSRPWIAQRLFENKMISVKGLR